MEGTEIERKLKKLLPSFDDKDMSDEEAVLPQPHELEGKDVSALMRFVGASCEGSGAFPNLVYEYSELPNGPPPSPPARSDSMADSGPASSSPSPPTSGSPPSASPGEGGGGGAKPKGAAQPPQPTRRRTVKGKQAERKDEGAAADGGGRGEAADKGSRSPLMSPGASPRVLRRDDVIPPPPVPPRKASPAPSPPSTPSMPHRLGLHDLDDEEELELPPAPPRTLSSSTLSTPMVVNAPATPITPMSPPRTITIVTLDPNNVTVESSTVGPTKDGALSAGAEAQRALAPAAPPPLGATHSAKDQQVDARVGVEPFPVVLVVLAHVDARHHAHALRPALPPALPRLHLVLLLLLRALRLRQPAQLLLRPVDGAAAVPATAAGDAHVPPGRPPDHHGAAPARVPVLARHRHLHARAHLRRRPGGPARGLHHLRHVDHHHRHHHHVLLLLHRFQLRLLLLLLRHHERHLLLHLHLLLVPRAVVLPPRHRRQRRRHAQTEDDPAVALLPHAPHPLHHPSPSSPSSITSSTSSSSSSASITGVAGGGPPDVDRRPSGTSHAGELEDIHEEPPYENTTLPPPVCSATARKSATDSDLPNFPAPSAPPLALITKSLSADRSMNVSEGAGEGEDAHTAYENLHMDYLATLTQEGFAQDAVIRALVITRNDIVMARDILREFASKRN
nr:uncharacterized protein LOC113799956 isoform X3 [Penaeus vannamei]